MHVFLCVACLCACVCVCGVCMCVCVVCVCMRVFVCVCVHTGDYVGESPPNDVIHIDVHCEVIVGDVPLGLHQTLSNGLQ